MKRIRSTLVIFYLALFIIFGAVNSSQNETTFPSLLSETWHITPFNNQNVTLIDSDDHVALYYDNIIVDYISRRKKYYNAHQWPFSELSFAWWYVTDAYGPIGPDPHLFIILHGNNSLNSSDQQCWSQSFLDPNGGNRNLIDCHFPTHQFKNGSLVETVQNFETIFSQIGEIMRYGAKGKYHDADDKICGNAMSDIIFYDIYCLLRSISSPSDVASWKNMTTRHRSWEDKEQICFDKWFIPIFKKYHGASVLNRYFELTKDYWETSGRAGSYEAMNLGEFVHFWSGAAREDLQHLASTAFQWTVDHQDELVKARDKYRFKFAYRYKVNTKQNNSSIPWKALAVICVCIVPVMVVMMFMVLRDRNKSRLKRLEKKDYHHSTTDSLAVLTSST